MKEEDQNKDIPLDKELQSMPPMFRELKQKVKGKIPENYFQDMQESVIDRIGEDQNKAPGSTTSIVRLLRPLIAVAAAIALVLVVRSAFISTSDDLEQLSAATELEMVEYLDVNLDNSDMESLFSSGMITEQDLEAILSEDDWSDENLEPFLDDEKWLDEILDNI